MTYRVLFLGEGSSDQAIGVHIDRIAESCGIAVQITAPDAEMLPTADKSVGGKLRAVRQLGGRYDAVFVHRDADREHPERRVAEVRAAMDDVMPGVVHAPVVPVRMTEAWLVLDEQLIRRTAGNPNGKVPLAIPSPAQAERIADPKALLKDLLVTASELTGRRRKSFQAAFSGNRRRILEQLDPQGQVRLLKSWQRFESDVAEALVSL